MGPALDRTASQQLLVEEEKYRGAVCVVRSPRRIGARQGLTRVSDRVAEFLECCSNSEVWGFEFVVAVRGQRLRSLRAWFGLRC